jgi:hypothetical protein
MQMSEIVLAEKQEKRLRALQQTQRRADGVLVKTQELWRHPDASTLKGRYPIARAVLENAIGKLRDENELEEGDKLQLMLVNLIIDLLTVEIELQDLQKAQGKAITPLGGLSLFGVVPSPVRTIPLAKAIRQTVDKI